MKTIYDLKLHETLKLQEQGFIVTRVPGGWIYDCFNSEPSLCFVPWSPEGKYEKN